MIGYTGSPAEAADVLWTAAAELGETRPPSRRAYLAGAATALGRHFLQQWARPFFPLVKNESERRQLAELAMIYLRIAGFGFFADPVRFFVPMLRAANIVDRVGVGREHSNVYSLTGLVLAGLGFPRRALQYGERAIEEAKSLQSPWHVANAHVFHAVVLLERGHWTDAFEHAELARDGFAACGSISINNAFVRS